MNHRRILLVKFQSMQWKLEDGRKGAHYTRGYRESVDKDWMNLG